MPGSPDLISQYIELLADTEAPASFHRWSCIAGLGAMLGNTVWYDDGLDNLHPNMYVLLVAPPGAKKSTSIKIMKKLMTQAGYSAFAAARTSKEKFLMDLAAGMTENVEADILDQNIFGALDGYTDLETSDSRECFITADEFTNFFGNNILDFVSILGELWDFKGIYSSRVKNSESILVHNPVISILSGSTPETIHEAFPASVIGQGFFSRLIFVYADPSGKKIAFPKRLPEEATSAYVESLVRMKTEIRGEIKHTPEAKAMLEGIYQTDVHIDDTRFTYYSTRRFAQLKKLCLIHAAADLCPEIRPEHVRRANTVLAHAERSMPRALGTLGQAKSSILMYKVLGILERTGEAYSLEELTPFFLGDMNSPHELVSVLNMLNNGGKVQVSEGKIMVKRQVHTEAQSEFFDWNYLTPEERGL